MQQRVRMVLALVGSIAALLIFMLAFQFIQSANVAKGESTAIGPGLKLSITGASIPGDRKPVVSFKLTDDSGTPLRLSDLDGNPSFTIAVLKQEADTGRTFWENPNVNTATGR